MTDEETRAAIIKRSYEIGVEKAAAESGKPTGTIKRWRSEERERANEPPRTVPEPPAPPSGEPTVDDVLAWKAHYKADNVKAAAHFGMTLEEIKKLLSEGRGQSPRPGHLHVLPNRARDPEPEVLEAMPTTRTGRLRRAIDLRLIELAKPESVGYLNQHQIAATIKSLVDVHPAVAELDKTEPGAMPVEEAPDLLTVEAREAMTGKLALLSPEVIEGARRLQGSS